MTLFHLVTSSSLVADVDVAISLPTVHRRQLFNSTVMSITVDKCKYEDLSQLVSTISVSWK